MATLDQIAIDDVVFDNPYALMDAELVASRFTDPTASTLFVKQDALKSETEANKAKDSDLSDKYILMDDKVGQAISNAGSIPGLLDAIDPGSSAQLASYYENYDRKTGEARKWLDNLYNYGSTSHPETTNIDLGLGGKEGTLRGVSIQNTVNTVYDSKNVGDAAKAILADCIPCKDRVMALLALNPLEDLMGILDIWYQGAIKGLIQGFDLVFGDKSNEVFADICELLKFLNFMCLPDLFGLVFLIQSLIQEYTWEWKDIKITFMSLLGKMMTPALTPLIGLIDRYVQLLMAPIECVFDALDAQIQKLDLVQLVDVVKDGKTKRQPTPNFAKDTKHSLVMFRDVVSKALAKADEKTKFLHKSLIEILGLEDEMNEHLFDLSVHIQRATKFIMLLQAIIRFLQRGFIVCGPNATSEDTTAFLNTLSQGLGEGFGDKDIVVENTGGLTNPSGLATDSQPSSNPVVKVSNKIPPELASAYTSLTNYLQTTVPKETDMPKEVVDQKLQGTLVVPIRNCLYTVRDKELENVKDFLGSFEKAI